MDPGTGAAGGALAKKATDAAVEETRNVVSRALGPSADVLGEWLADKLEFRLTNVGRIARASERRAGGRDGQVHPRVAHQVLEDGSFNDGELAAEYFGGILAASKTPDGKSDEGVAWTSVLQAMSGAQIRAHYLIYREYHLRLQGRADADLEKHSGVGAGHHRATMFVELNELVRAIVPPTDMARSGMVFQHALLGLRRNELLVVSWRVSGDVEPSNYSQCPYDQAVQLRPTQPGLELYGWCQGRNDISYSNFHTMAHEAFDADPPTPRLDSAVLPYLGDPPREQQ